jgi:hypothetical protein
VSAPDPIAEARERGRLDALESLNDALLWQRAELWQRYHWMKQDPAGRDPYDTRGARLLDRMDGLRLATDELFYHRFPGAWDRERDRERKAYERGGA